MWVRDLSQCRSRSEVFVSVSQHLQRYVSNKAFFCLLVCIVGSTYVAAGLNQGWIPFDDGVLAHTAERVLAGGLPHRDFDEGYTGGLTFANALAFRILGINLGTLRIVLFAFTVPWIAAMFYIASRFSSPLAAGCLTLLAVCWSVPNYPAALPSWYNLFFATFGCAAVFRYLEVGQRRWLFVAGICGGLSVLVKVAGLYYFIALLVFAAYWEQSSVPDRGSRIRSVSAYSLMLASGVSCLAVAIYSVIHRRPGLPEVLHFIVPGAILLVILLERERGRYRFASVERFKRLSYFAVPVLAGALLPSVVFVAPYILGHSVKLLYRGVFVLPLVRLNLAAHRPPALETFIPAVALALFLAVLIFWQKQPSRMAILTAWVAAIGLPCYSHFSRAAFAIVLFSAWTLVPMLILLAVPLLLDGASVREQQLMLMCGLSAFCGQIQFPYTNAIYFCYVAPLVALTVGSLLSNAKRPKSQLSSATLVLYGIFAVFSLTPWARAGNTHLETKPVHMNLARADGIEVNPIQARTYEKLVELLKKHSRGGPIYVTPSSPEVYFLADMRNPTRTIMDAFDFSNEPIENIIKRLEKARVNTVVINQAGEYVGPSNGMLQMQLRSHFHQSEKVGAFEVRWNE